MAACLAERAEAGLSTAPLHIGRAVIPYHQIEAGRANPADHEDFRGTAPGCKAERLFVHGHPDVWMCTRDLAPASGYRRSKSRLQESRRRRRVTEAALRGQRRSLGGGTGEFSGLRLPRPSVLP